MALEINIQTILNTLSYQFNALIKEKEYPINSVIVGNERYFLENQLDENDIGIVFSLGSGLADLNEAVLPFSLLVLSRDEKMEMTQTLLYDFILNYTNTAINGFYQRYSTPSMEDEFIEYGNEIRSSWFVNGTIKFISTNSAVLSIAWLNDENEYEQIETLETRYTINNEPSPQPMSDTYGENITINRINTFTLNFTTYANQSNFYKKVLASQISTNNKNLRFDMKLDFGLGNNYIYNVGMVVSNIDTNQKLGENAIVSITMAR